MRSNGRSPAKQLIWIHAKLGLWYDLHLRRRRNVIDRGIEREELGKKTQNALGVDGAGPLIGDAIALTVVVHFEEAAAGGAIGKGEQVLVFKGTARIGCLYTAQRDRCDASVT